MTTDKVRARIREYRLATDVLAVAADNQRLRAALRRIAELTTKWAEGPDGNLERAREIARQAMEDHCD
jgi:hypothetical protein